MKARPLILIMGMTLFAVTIADGAGAASQIDPKIHSAAEALVAKGLRAEIDGNTSQRTDALSSALSVAPDYAPARWANGFVHHGKTWTRYDEPPGSSLSQEILALYRLEREQYPDTAQGQLDLADWCRHHGLKEQERAHLLRLSQLDPNQSLAKRRLGLIPVDGVWMTSDQLRAKLARGKREAIELNLWSPKLRRLGQAVVKQSGKPQNSAAEQLKAIRDPTAIPAMEAVLSSNHVTALAAVEAFSRMRVPEAALALARQAVFNESIRVQELASEKLKSFPEDSYVPALLSSLVTPTVVQTQVVPGIGAGLTIRQSFQNEGQDKKTLAVFDHAFYSSNGATVSTLAGAGIDEAIQGEQAVAVQNLQVEELNRRICKLLQNTTGQSFADSYPPEYWWQWWNDHNEVYQPGGKPTQVTYNLQTTEVPRRRSSCLVAGTPVWTDRGEVAIEQVKVGDLVLTQHPDTGELAYKPVVQTTIRPDGSIVRFHVDGQTIRATGGHPFWVAGQGWTRARDLKPGMRLHGLNGSGTVETVEINDDGHEPTYNLIVQDVHNYFVGAGRWLSHDNTPREPTRSAVPGLVIGNK